MSDKTRTMYMHTLDDQPAGYSDLGGRPYVFFVGGRHRVKLVPSLRQLQREQQATIRQDRAEGQDPGRFRYGYVLVEVP